jgi:hypothetical protein
VQRRHYYDKLKFVQDTDRASYRVEGLEKPNLAKTYQESSVLSFCERKKERERGGEKEVRARVSWGWMV